MIKSILISILMMLAFSISMAATDLKYPTINHTGPIPPNDAGSKRGTMLNNMPTYVKIYNNDFKKLNNVDFDILADEQAEYLIQSTVGFADSYYAKSWDELLKFVNQNMNRLATVRMNSFELNLANETAKKITSIEQKLAEYEKVKNSVTSAAAINDRMLKNENEISRNASIMWGAIILAIIYMVLFRRRK